MISNRVIQKTTIFQFKRPIALFVIFLLGNLVNAQIKLEGVVKDSIGQPLELANVIAINQATKAMQGYAITRTYHPWQCSMEEGKDCQHRCWHGCCIRVKNDEL